MELFRNDYFRVFLDGINVWIDVFMKGFDIKEFSVVSAKIPRLRLTNFGNLTKALQMEINQPIIIGVFRRKVEMEISSDGLEAYALINLTEEEYHKEQTVVVQEIIGMIKDAEITTGILKEVFTAPLPLMKKFHIAKGKGPIDGQDAIVKLFELSDRKPRILVNGSVNHYELNLIDNINVGEWLGEKTQATLGTCGVNVKGEEIPSKSGRDFPLRFDAKTVSLTKDASGKETLYALKDGAVRISQDRIGVDNHLKISGDVDYTTGNVNFDGFITISGTVKDGFSVIALNDITIQSDMGVGAVGEIRSKTGSIFIKGGVNGKNTAKIIAGNHIFLKYVNEADVIAENSINIGFYAMDSLLKSKKVMVNPDQGRVIGGKIEAEYQIIAGTIGNQSERRTDISVSGFERCSVKDELDAALIHYKDVFSRTNKIKRQLEIFETHIGQLDEKALNTFKGMVISHEHAMDEILRLNQKIAYLQEVLKTRGDGEVQISKSAYPKTFMEIKNFQKRIKDVTSGSFYVKDNDLQYEG